MVDFNQISENVIKGQAPKVSELVSNALSEGVTAQNILHQGLIKGMDVVGEKFKTNQFYIPEVLIAARAMKTGLELIRPLLAEAGVEPLGKVAIGTVKGDLHDIGKNLVGMMLEGTGFEVLDLGIDVSPDQYIDAIQNQDAQIIGMSALLTTTMPEMKTIINAIEEAGFRDQVKVLIGGAPVTQSYADEIGADGYARDAASGADSAKQLIGAL